MAWKPTHNLNPAARLGGRTGPSTGAARGGVVAVCAACRAGRRPQPVVCWGCRRSRRRAARVVPARRIARLLGGIVRLAGVALALGRRVPILAPRRSPVARHGQGAETRRRRGDARGDALGDVGASLAEAPAAPARSSEGRGRTGCHDTRGPCFSPVFTGFRGVGAEAAGRPKCLRVMRLGQGVIS